MLTWWPYGCQTSMVTKRRQPHDLMLVYLTRSVFLTKKFLINLPFKESKCGYVLIIVSLYWTTGLNKTLFISLIVISICNNYKNLLFFAPECLPIGITSLIPIVLFPLLGIMSSKNVTVLYFQVYKKIIYCNTPILVLKGPNEVVTRDIFLYEA